MDERLERRVLELLRDTRGAPLPLRRLHGRLVAEAGPTVGAYARFADDIRSSRAFVVIEPDDPLGDSRDWPPALRTVYENALAAAGIERGPRLALASPIAAAQGSAESTELHEPGRIARPNAPKPDTPIAAVHASLLDAWDGAGAHAGLRAAIAAAFADCAEMRGTLADDDE
jgi:hypothetical protein